MAVPGKFGAMRGTTGSAFTQQVMSGAVMGIVSGGSPVITKSLQLNTALTTNPNMTTMVKERDSGNGLIRAKKALSSGTFGYMSPLAWVITKVSTTLSGVAKTNLLYMAQGSKVVSIHEFKHDFGVKMLTAWLTGSFAWTGKFVNGTSKNSRKMWLNGAGSAISDPSTLSGTFMYDIADANASDIANDHAARPTRAVPGEFVLMADFVTAGLSGGNFFDYKPITGM